MARILITGASGLLGANLALAAHGAGHAVTGTARSAVTQLPSVRMMEADLAETGAAQRVVDAAEPDWVVHCAAATNLDACEADPESAERVNRDAARAVAQAAQTARSRLVYVSTDAVFDGVTGGYRETDDPHPINVYGRTKWEGERAVAEEHSRPIIARTNFFGWSLRGNRSLAEWFLMRWGASQPCPGFTDMFFSPLLVNDLARFLLELLAKDSVGLFHVSGASCLSKFDFGVQLAETFDYPADWVVPASVDSARLRAPRGRHLCLESDRLVSEIFPERPNIRQSLNDFRDLRAGGYPLAGPARTVHGASTSDI